MPLCLYGKVVGASRKEKGSPVFPEGMTMDEIIEHHARLRRKPSWD